MLDFDGVRLILFVSGSAAVNVQHWSIQLPTGETLFAGPGVRWWVAGGASG